MLVREHSQQAQIGGVVDFLDIADRLIPRFDAAKHVLPQLLDVLRIRSIQARAFVDNRFAVVGWIKSPTFPPAHMEGAISTIKIAADILALFSVVPSKSSVLPSSGEGFKLIGGDLVIGRIGCLLSVVIDRISRYLASTR